jgi:hypothetical protein
MTALLARTADRLLRMVVPTAVGSACGLYIGHCYLASRTCGGSACVDYWQCATSQSNYWCEVYYPGGQYVYGGCC